MSEQTEREIEEAAQTAFAWACSVLEKCDKYNNRYWRALVLSRLGSIAVDNGEAALGGKYELHDMPVRFGGSDVLVNGYASYYYNEKGCPVDFLSVKVHSYQTKGETQGLTPTDFKALEELILIELTNNYELRKELNNA